MASSKGKRKSNGRREERKNRLESLDTVSRGTLANRGTYTFLTQTSESRRVRERLGNGETKPASQTASHTRSGQAKDT